MMIGVCHRSRTRRARVSPSMPGSIRSRSRMSKRCCVSRESACTPSGATTASTPCCPRNSRSSSDSLRSSSMRRAFTIPPSVAPALLAFATGDAGKAGSSALIVRAAPRDPGLEVSGSSKTRSPRRGGEMWLLAPESTLGPVMVLLNQLDDLRPLLPGQGVVNFFGRRDDHRGDVLHVLRSRVRERLQSLSVELVCRERRQQGFVRTPVSMGLGLDGGVDVVLGLLLYLPLIRCGLTLVQGSMDPRVDAVLHESGPSVMHAGGDRRSGDGEDPQKEPDLLPALHLRPSNA